ncbi:MAG: NAD-dependent epimerase/dehydratase family protein [Candidatus Levybacteria bacterium]|nr:NAD-dependent epimerase/dehydratase family protein [Candidatus Levybacteria bacterium]
MAKSNVLVTGSAGFVGFHVAKRLLERGENVIGVDNLNDYYDVSLKKDRNSFLLKDRKYSFHQIDISNASEVEKLMQGSKIDRICHLAAQAGVRYSLVNPALYTRTNIEGFINIIESAKKHNINEIVYASSSSVYGNNPMPSNGFSESDAVNQPISVYGMTKRANELTAYAYHHLYGINFTGLRFFTAYGPWGRPDMAYFSFTKAILENKPIKVFNEGNMRRDFTYIDDVVDGVIKALEKPFPYEIFNIGNSRTVELSYLIGCIERELHKKAILDMQPLQPGDVTETFANISHAEEFLGFRPKIAIDDGLKEFIRWYNEYYGKS